LNKLTILFNLRILLFLLGIIVLKLFPAKNIFSIRTFLFPIHLNFWFISLTTVLSSYF